MPQFDKVHIEITNICNLQCSFCPEVERQKGLMALPLFEKIVEQVAPLTRQVCFHLMGDPLLHPKLSEFVALCEKQRLKIFFVTNGVLLKPHHFALLLSPAFRQINFSLHSFPDNYPERDPTDYLQRIFDFTELALTERPDLFLNYRLWNLENPRQGNAKNISLLERIESHFGKVDRSAIDVRRKKSYPLKQRLYLHFDTEFVWPQLDLPLLGVTGKCYGLKSHFGILVDGTVVPCCLDKEGNIPLGNIQEASILEILNSARAVAIRKGFSERKLIEPLCQRCQYIERFDSLDRFPKMAHVAQDAARD